MNKQIIEIYQKLKKSPFRSKFHLRQNELDYVNQNGMDVIRNHAYDFINKRLAPVIILNDGKQTPMKGHPVFIAQHATATCCRNCLYKWHHIAKDKCLTNQEIDYVVDTIMYWIEQEINN